MLGSQIKSRWQNHTGRLTRPILTTAKQSIYRPEDGQSPLEHPPYTVRLGLELGVGLVSGLGLGGMSGRGTVRHSYRPDSMSIVSLIK